MKKLTVFLCLLLTVSLCLASFASCGEKTEDSSSEGETSSEESHDASKDFPYPDFYEEKTLNILCIETARHTYGELQFCPEEESKFTAVNEAVRARNDLIEEKYGLTIQLTPVKYPLTELRNAFESGLSTYDLVCDSVDSMVQSVTESFFWSVDDLLDLDKAWWNKEAMDSLSIAGKHYFLCGDALITDDDNTYLYLFNKQMYDDNQTLKTNYGDLYRLVDDHKFTLDTFEAMCKEASHVSEYGNWDFYATYGNLSHAYGATILVNGCNLAMADIDDSTGYFKLNVDSERGVEIFDKVYRLMSNKQITQRAELIIGQGSNPSSYGFAELEEMFVNGRGLFYNTTSSSISILKSMAQGLSFDFGVLPIPLLDESQEHYYSAVNRYQSSVIGIPVNNTENLDATCALLQALGCYSEDVTNAYYSQTLQLQALTDNDDARMLDLIYDNRFYDLGSMFNWANGALIGFYGNVIANSASNTLISAWDKIKDAVANDMQATVDAYQKSVT